MDSSNRANSAAGLAIIVGDQLRDWNRHALSVLTDFPIDGGPHVPRRQIQLHRQAAAQTRKRRRLKVANRRRAKQAGATPMAERFEGKIVIVTGSASGIGEATARRFVAEVAARFTGRQDRE
jgi:FlaA1/EpsC-like NDP-sugar epimerase